MFRLHETTRRRVCRTAFLLLCVAPTIATLAWILHAHRPGRVRDEEARLGGLLHVELRAADWRRPRPKTVHSTSLRLGEPGTVEPLVTVHGLTWRDGAAIHCSIESAELDATQLAQLAVRTSQWVASLDRPCHVDVGRLRIRGIGGEASLENLVARVDRKDDGDFTLSIVVRQSDMPAEQGGIRVAAAGRTGASGPALRATVDASQARLPLWALRSAIPLVGDLGSAATFTGVVQLQAEANVASGHARGRLGNVSFAALASPGAMEAASGEVQVEIEELGWSGREIVTLAGVVQGSHLAVRRNVIAAAEQCFGVGTITNLREAGDGMVPVDQLNARFQLDRDALTIVGNFPTDAALAPGCLAASNGQALIVAGPRLYPAAWVQFTGGPAASWIPATRRAVERAGHLPLTAPPASQGTTDAP